MVVVVGGLTGGEPTGEEAGRGPVTTGSGGTQPSASEEGDDGAQLRDVKQAACRFKSVAST